VNTARRAQPWLGTLVDIALADPGAAAPQAAFDAAFAAIAAIHNAMSPQHPDSDLARFNTAIAGSALPCAARTRNVLQAARTLGEASDGIFDITLGSGGLSAWSLQGDRLHKHRDGARLDLGGLAKGYAVDAAIAAL
jgi:thiamine biosynthesis lipoprotein